MPSKERTRRGRGKAAARPDPESRRLDAMIEEATVDAYDEEEQLMGFYSLLEEHLELPFRTRVLGEEVSVESIQETDAGGIVASCRRGPHRQAISLLELPLPDPPPRGAEWIEAYRRWARG